MSATVVETASGKVSGIAGPGVTSFLGIPYGSCAGPAGRFRPASPPRPWTGVREAVAFGPAAPQAVRDLSNVLPPEFLELGAFGPAERPAQDEECLVLNVWTPAADAARRPVMVWLHGSPFNQGTGSGHDGAPLARSGDVVVVTPNHRLGALGFVHLEEAVPGRYPGSGVAGMLDLVAALGWVRDNIAGFGGDPANVTVFGCSGGGMKTTTLLAMPAATGLFHRAIIQSGPYVRAVPADRAAEFTDRLLRELELDPARAALLETTPAGRLVEAQEAVLRELETRAVGEGGLEAAGPTRFIAGVATGGTLWDLGPVVDGAALPEHPFDPSAPPSAAAVPLIVGLNRDESALWLMMYPNANGLSAGELEEISITLRGDTGRDLLALYRRTRPSAEPQDLLDAMVSTDQMWIDLVHIAERKAAGGSAPVFMYQFAYRSDAVGGRLRAAHGLEVPFVFNDVERSKMTGTRPERVGLAEAMSSAWVAFARTGDPNHPGLPTWPRYAPGAERSSMVFDVPCRLGADPTELREGLDALGIEFARRR